jgi:hypothetical protein
MLQVSIFTTAASPPRTDISTAARSNSLTSALNSRLPFTSASVSEADHNHRKNLSDSIFLDGMIIKDYYLNGTWSHFQPFEGLKPPFVELDDKIHSTMNSSAIFLDYTGNKFKTKGYENIHGEVKVRSSTRNYIPRPNFTAPFSVENINSSVIFSPVERARRQMGGDFITKPSINSRNLVSSSLQTTPRSATNFAEEPQGETFSGDDSHYNDREQLKVVLARLELDCHLKMLSDPEPETGE